MPGLVRGSVGGHPYGDSPCLAKEPAMSPRPEVTDLFARLGELAVRNTASAISTRIQSIRARKASESTINELVELIDELVDERSQILGIARALEEQLLAQRISDTEITYITTSVIPTLDTLLDLAPDDGTDSAEVLDAVKTLLSVETLTILQLIGFNFKDAIGVPLTRLVERLILAKFPPPDTSQELALLNARREVAYLELLNNPEAAARLDSSAD
jgi:hypothetical protein